MRKNLLSAIQSGERSEIETAMRDFKAMLTTEKMRKKESNLLERAQYILYNIEKRESIVIVILSILHENVKFSISTEFFEIQIAMQLLTFKNYWLIFF